MSSSSGGNGGLLAEELSLTAGMKSATRDPRSKRMLDEAWRALWRSSSGRVSIALLSAMFLIAALAPIIAPHDPLALDVRLRFESPSPTHWLGTDELGRDIMSRILYGARISLTVGVVSVFMAMVIGGLVGLFAGTRGQLVDNILMRAMDVLLAFPSTLLAIAIVTARGPGLFNTLMAIGVVRVPHYARVVRSIVLGIRELDYVMAARSIGTPEAQIMFRHILPNTVSVLIVQATLGIGSAIIEAAALGFLGLGAQPPTPEWGAMLSASYVYLLRAPWAIFAPGAAVVLAVVAFNLFGDALRDALDPRMRRW